MIIKNIATYLENLKQKDIKPEIFTVWPFPEGLTVLEILNSIGYKLAHLWDSVKINTTTETTDDATAQVNVSGDVDQLNFDFKIPRGKDGKKGDPGVSVTVGNTTTLAAGESASVTNSGTDSDPVLNFGIPQGAAGEPGPENLVMITATASTTTQGDYTPGTTFADALADIQANKVVCIKLENLPGRFYIPYSSSNSEILASAGTVSGSNQSIELYTIRWAADTNIISITGTKKGCIADGGQAGQVLVKKSNESFDVEWKSLIVLTNDKTYNYNEITNKFKAGELILFYNDSIKAIYVASIISNNTLYGFCENAVENNMFSTKKAALLSNGVVSFFGDSAYFIPNGGTTGQVLAKKSNTNGDAEWVNTPIIIDLQTLQNLALNEMLNKLYMIVDDNEVYITLSIKANNAYFYNVNPYLTSNKFQIAFITKTQESVNKEIYVYTSASNSLKAKQVLAKNSDINGNAEWVSI